MQGIIVLVFALLLALSLYTSAIGVVGRLLDDLTARGLGLGRYVLPVGLAALGWQRLRPPAARRNMARLRGEIVAWTLFVLAVLCVLDLVGGRPGWGSPLPELAGAGGWAGVWIGGSIERYLGYWGEIIITAALLVIALVMLTSLSAGNAAEAVSVQGVRLRDWLADTVRGSLRQGTPQPTTGAADSSTPGVLLDLELPGDAKAAKRGPKAKKSDTPERPEGFDLAGGADPFADAAYIDLRNDVDAPTLHDIPDSELEPTDAGRGDHDRSVDPESTLGAPDAAVLTRWNDPAPPPFIDIPVPAQVDPLAMMTPLPGAGAWTLPPMDLLGRSEGQDIDRASVEKTGRQLEHALAEHGVETRLIGVVVGPTVSRFELELGPGVKVNRVTSLHKDIAYAMATPDVRILAPIPGKQAIGVEVPNVRRQIITVGDLLYSEEAARATHPLEVTLGRDITGKTVMANLAKMPHLLVAGQTGSGKSSCINSMLTSLLMRTTPEQVRLILVDPKRVELTQYERLPHLLTEVVTDPKKAANALAWGVREMERRYDLLSEIGVRDIDGFNKAVVEGRIPPRMGPDGELVDVHKLSYIVIVLDELADLMMVAARDVEESICRIAQKARAVGIHLVIATQRPSTNVITGLIKANVPARLAFAVSSLTDSRVILDQSGAERLVGRGDGLLLDGTTSTAARFQGAWVTEEEVSAIVEYWIAQAPEIVFDSRVQGEEVSEAAAALPGGTTGDEDDDELLLQAMELVVRSQLGSTSMLQRKLRVGFARAGRLMDLLEERGVVGPSLGSKAREVQMSAQDLDAGNWPPAMRGGAGSAPTSGGESSVNRSIPTQGVGSQQPMMPQPVRSQSAPRVPVAPPSAPIDRTPAPALPEPVSDAFDLDAVDLGDSPEDGGWQGDDDAFGSDFDPALAPPPGYRRPE